MDPGMGSLQPRRLISGWHHLLGHLWCCNCNAVTAPISPSFLLRRPGHMHPLKCQAILPTSLPTACQPRRHTPPPHQSRSHGLLRRESLALGPATLSLINAAEEGGATPDRIRLLAANRTSRLTGLRASAPPHGFHLRLRRLNPRPELRTPHRTDTGPPPRPCPPPSRIPLPIWLLICKQCCIHSQRSWL